jgi:hypothetical protein
VAVSRRHSSVFLVIGAQLLHRFHSSRYPTKPADIARKFDAAENNHIIFVRKNKFFQVPLAYNGVELSEAELQVYVFVSLSCYPPFHSQTPGKLNESSSWLGTNLAFRSVLSRLKIVTFGQRCVQGGDSDGVDLDRTFCRLVKVLLAYLSRTEFPSSESSLL